MPDMKPGSYSPLDYYDEQIGRGRVIYLITKPTEEEEDPEDILLLADPQVQQDLQQSALDIADGNLVRWEGVQSKKIE